MDFEYSNGGTFISCTFIDCSAGDESERGGALSLEDGEKFRVVDNCSFSDCYVQEMLEGGAIHCSVISTFIVKNGSSFTRCWTGGRGGAIYGYWISCFFMHDSQATGCEAKETDGGGIYLAGCPSNTIFQTCADHEEADLSNKGVLNNVNILDWSANASGGALHLYNSANGFIVDNCCFSTCGSRSWSGGAILQDNGESAFAGACDGQFTTRGVAWKETLDETFRNCRFTG